MDISGNGRYNTRLKKLEEKSMQDFENYRVVEGKLETTDRSRWLEEDERIYWDTDTGEVRIKKNV